MVLRIYLPVGLQNALPLLVTGGGRRRHRLQRCPHAVVEFPIPHTHTFPCHWVTLQGDLFFALSLLVTLSGPLFGVVAVDADDDATTVVP